MHTESTDTLPCVLIVDDDTQSIVLMHRVLEGLSRVVFATNGDDALRQIDRHHPDLVLLDADMPGLGGFDTCLAIRRKPESADLPVIFVTALTDTDTETRALDIGAIDVIHKPVNPPVVLARVRTHLALKHKTDELRRLSALDALTGIANRRVFDETLAKEWRRAQRTRTPLSLLLIDIDHFKRYNDAYGHPAGDACLRQVGAILAGFGQRGGDVAARYGGEEFALILPQTSAGDARACAERLCAEFRRQAIPHRDSPVSPYLTLSIGVGTLHQPCMTAHAAFHQCRHCNLAECCHDAPKALLALADRALYMAKHNGRARVVDLVGTTDEISFTSAPL